MDKLKSLKRMSFGLGIIVLIGLFSSVLALLDIYQNNEPDLYLEWNIIRVTFLFTLMYVVVSLITISKIKK
jgi:uncharacterized membrane protein